MRSFHPHPKHQWLISTLIKFFGAFLLVFVLLAVLDRKNGPPPAGLVPVVLFFILFGLGMALGAQTGFAVNPARDLGPVFREHDVFLFHFADAALGELVAVDINLVRASAKA